MKTCGSCSNKTICKYFEMMASFPGTIEVSNCLFSGVAPAGNQKAPPLSNVRGELPPFTRSLESLRETTEKIRALTSTSDDIAPEITSNAKQECVSCHEKRSDCVPCFDCGKPVCGHCANTELGTGKVRCEECWDKCDAQIIPD